MIMTHLASVSAIDISISLFAHNNHHTRFIFYVTSSFLSMTTFFLTHDDVHDQSDTSHPRTMWFLYIYEFFMHMNIRLCVFYVMQTIVLVVHSSLPSWKYFPCNLFVCLWLSVYDRNVFLSSSHSHLLFECISCPFVQFFRWQVCCFIHTDM